MPMNCTGRTSIFLYCILVAFCCTCFAAPACKDPSGRDVDWWITYKLPSINGNDNKFIEGGLGYGYLDSNSISFKVATNKGMNSSDTAVVNTLNQIYNGNSNVGNIMWSDQPPVGKDSSTRAHAKGVMGFVSNGGFFLRHSIPRFPPEYTSSYSYPDSALIYGQNLLCMTMDITNLDIVASQFQINNPNIYSVHVPSSVKAQHIIGLANGNTNKSLLVSSRTMKLKSGLQVTDFAKARAWNKDLWEDEVAVTLQRNMYVESWGRPLEHNACKPNYQYSVQNVHKVDFGNDTDFLETKDHSKWGISSDGSFTCIGDINRMTSQRKRGGGTTCFNIAGLHKVYSSIISSVDKC